MEVDFILQKYIHAPSYDINAQRRKNHGNKRIPHNDDKRKERRRIPHNDDKKRERRRIPQEQMRRKRPVLTTTTMNRIPTVQQIGFKNEKKSKRRENAIQNALDSIPIQNMKRRLGMTNSHAPDYIIRDLYENKMIRGIHAKQ